MTRSSKLGLGIAGLLAGGLLVTTTFLFHRIRGPLENYIRNNIVIGLREHFKADVQLSALHISLFPQVHVVGEGLILRRTDAADAPPLISVRKFILDGAVREIFSHVPRFQLLTLDGLEMHIPAHREDRRVSHSIETNKLNFIINEIVSSDAEIDILRVKADKPTLVFAIHKLKIKSFQPGRAAAFHSTLQNPRPIGEIEVDGELGPWNGTEPSETPLNGKYEYRHADLARSQASLAPFRQRANSRAYSTTFPFRARPKSRISQWPPADTPSL
jgi:uncharacterized protein involved in outer membrane biogenesis